ncbi:MAG: NAD-dependent epimerase/dehydratase family protein [Treponema sp.]|jgi:dTDP-L-rhamnose 4-epimerase|nr:NAD-dependent epimerase/dehydratase family protein [Treponema sp.]
MKRILITGGAGFIGSNIAHKLTAKEYEVVILDNLSPQIHGDNPEENSPLFCSILKNPKIQFIKGTITLRNDWRKVLNGIDAIIHLAAETGTGQSMYEIEKYIDVNIMGTGLLLDILTNEKHGIKRVVVASSRAIYGEGRYKCPSHGEVYPTQRLEEDMCRGDFECKCPFCSGTVELLSTTENSKIHPTSLYGITKQNQEQMVMVICKSLGIDAVSFRYQNVYGPGQSLSNPYTGILSIFSTQIKNSNPITIFEDGLESRDFVYIDDVVDATILGLEIKEAAGLSFNIGADKPIDVITVARKLRENYNSTIKINISGNFRLGDIRHNYADITLAKQVLGYIPKVNFIEGIGHFCDWVNTQDIQKDRYNESIEEMKRKGLYK